MKFKLSVTLATFFWFLHTVPVAGQIINDTTQMLYGPETTRILHEHRFFRGNYTEVTVDTSLNNNYSPYFWFSDTTFQQTLSNIGLATKPLLYQFPEKILPLFVTNLMDNIPVPLYGDGGNIRDWLHVLDHCRGIDLLMHAATNGEVYNIGGGNEVKNIDLTHKVLKLAGKGPELIKPVQDRKGHDRRYSLSSAKLRAMGWAPQVDFAQGLAETVAWYQANPPA